MEMAPLAMKDSLACRCCRSEQEPMDSITQIGGEELCMSAKDFLYTIEDA
jgi:hypothetical protein